MGKKFKIQSSCNIDECIESVFENLDKCTKDIKTTETKSKRKDKQIKELNSLIEKNKVAASDELKDLQLQIVDILKRMRADPKQISKTYFLEHIFPNSETILKQEIENLAKSILSLNDQISEYKEHIKRKENDIRELDVELTIEKDKTKVIRTEIENSNQEFRKLKLKYDAALEQQRE